MSECEICGECLIPHNHYTDRKVCKECHKKRAVQSNKKNRGTKDKIQSIKNKKSCVVCGQGEEKERLYLVANASLLLLRLSDLEKTPAIHLHCLLDIQQRKLYPKKLDKRVVEEIKNEKKKWGCD